MFCTVRNFSPPWARNAAFARSSALLVAEITTAGVAAVEGEAAVPFFGPVSCPNTVILRTNDNRPLRTKVFLIIIPSSLTILEVQTHLRIDSTIARASATTPATAEAAKSSGES